MKFLINEDKRLDYAMKFIEDLIQKKFKKLYFFDNIDGRDYATWLSQEQFESGDDPLELTQEGFSVFHKNFYGILWIEDCSFYKEFLKLMEMLSYDETQSKLILREYLQLNYPVKLKGVNDECDWDLN